MLGFVVIEPEAGLVTVPLGRDDDPDRVLDTVDGLVVVFTEGLATVPETLRLTEPDDWRLTEPDDWLTEPDGWRLTEPDDLVGCLSDAEDELDVVEPLLVCA